jgi:hypothetical protein
MATRASVPGQPEHFVQAVCPEVHQPGHREFTLGCWQDDDEMVRPGVRPYPIFALHAGILQKPVPVKIDGGYLASLPPESLALPIAPGGSCRIKTSRQARQYISY